MIAKNMLELENLILKEMRKALNITSKKALADMQEQTGDFYTGGEPVMYERTGALGNTPMTTSISVTGNTVSFDAYLDTQYTYTTGSNPSMEAILGLAETGSYTGLAPVVGKQGFWKRAHQNIQKDFDDTMRSFFD